MTAVKESQILMALRRVLLWLWAQLEDSCLGRFAAWIWRGGRNSALVGFVRREGAMDRDWESSRCHRVLDRLLNAPGTFCKFLRRKTAGMGDSWVFGALGFVGRHFALFGGLFFAAMVMLFNSYWNNLYGVMGAFALLVLLYIGFARRRERSIRTAAAGPFMPIYILAVLYAFAISPSYSESLRFLLFQLTGIVLVYLMVSGLRSLKDLRTFIYILLAAVTLAGLYGCYQRILGVEPDDSLVDMTLDLNKNMPGRIYSTYGNPNNFAELLVLTIPLYLAAIFNEKRTKMKLLVFLFMLPPILAIAMTYSRSSWIGLVLALLLFVTLKNWRLLPLVLVLGLLALPFLPASIYNRILSIGVLEDSSTSYRFHIYREFFLLLRDKWLTGVGLGSDVVYDAIKSGYPQMANGYYPVHAHNNYVQIWAEMGAVGLLGYLGLVLNSFKRGVRAVCARRLPAEAENYLIALVGSLAGILVISIAEYTWFYPRVMFMFWSVIGLIGACIYVGKGEVRPHA